MIRRTPTLQKRRLIMALKEARERAGHTQKEVAAALEWSPSKLLRMENGQVKIETTDLQALLGQYGVKGSPANRFADRDGARCQEVFTVCRLPGCADGGTDTA